MSKALPIIMFGLSALLGCASGGGNPSPGVPIPEASPGEQTPPATQDEKSHKAWKITPSTRADSYASTIKTSVQQEGSVDSRTDHFTTVTTYTLGLTRSANEIEFSGEITAFDLKSENANQAFIPLTQTFPVAFDGKISAHSLTVNRAGQTVSQIPCADSLLTMLSSISKDLVAAPIDLNSNEMWQDSTSMIICSGSLPLVLSTIRNYRLTGEGSFNNSPVLILERTEKILANGQGSQGQHQIVIETSGTGAGQVYLDPITGSLFGVRAKTQTRISIKSSGRIQNFIQTTEETTDRKN